RVGVGTEGGDAQGLGQLEVLAVGVVVLGERLHAVGGRLDAVLLAQLPHRGELGRGALQRDVSVEELGVLQAERLVLLEGLFEVEVAEAVALGADLGRPEARVVGGQARAASRPRAAPAAAADVARNWRRVGRGRVLMWMIPGVIPDPRADCGSAYAG